MRRELDFYPTPVPYVQAVWDFVERRAQIPGHPLYNLSPIYPQSPHNPSTVSPQFLLNPSISSSQLPRIIDAGCGVGPFMKLAPAHYNVIGVEMDLERAEFAKAHGRVHVGDFLTAQLPSADLVIGNPPYEVAQSFVERALQLAPACTFLLRLGFLASARRKKMNQNHLVAVEVLSSRPSFSQNGRVDMSDYAIFEYQRVKTSQVELTIHSTL